jgi:hypothetical protein
MFDLVVDIFMVVGALTPLAAYEQWREFRNARVHAGREPKQAG